MADDPDRRHLVDPRYITWEVFEPRWREVNERFSRDERQAELHESATNRALSEQGAEIIRLRIATARQAVYVSLVQALLTVGATAWLTIYLSHRGP